VPAVNVILKDQYITCVSVRFGPKRAMRGRATKTALRVTGCACLDDSVAYEISKSESPPINRVEYLEVQTRLVVPAQKIGPLLRLAQEADDAAAIGVIHFAFLTEVRSHGFRAPKAAARQILDISFPQTLRPPQPYISGH
jgi:hypothetical protein